MAAHADFAASFVLGEQLLRDIVQVLHRNDQLDHQLQGSFSVNLPGGGSAQVDIDFFLGPPTVTLGAAKANPVFGLAGWGPLSVTLPGKSVVTRRARMAAELTVPTTLKVKQSKLSILVDGINSSLDHLEFEAISGGTFPPDVDAFLKSQSLHDAVQTAIGLKLVAMKQLGPDIDLSFLTSSLPGVNLKPKSRVLDGAIAVGVDFASGTVTTMGDATTLTDFRSGDDIAAALNPVISPVIFEMVRSSVAAAAAKEGATLNSFSVTMQEGHLLVAGTASNDEGSVTFSVEELPHLFRPAVWNEWEDEEGTHRTLAAAAREEVWFQAWNITVDIQRAWWVWLLETLGGVLSFGFTTGFAEMAIAMARANIVAGIQLSASLRLTACTQEFTLPGTTAPTMRLHIDRLESHAEGMVAGSTLRPQWAAAKLTGDSWMSVESMVMIRPGFQVTLPASAHPADPQLRVRWTLRRLDRNEVIDNTDGPAWSTRSYFPDVSEYTDCSVFTVACRLYRELGSVTEDLFNGIASLNIYDRLDRSHPYVRWDHDVSTPVVEIEQDGTHTILGRTTTRRHSAIHRTQYPGRCRMVSKYSGKVSDVDVPGADEPHLEYLDALPFPLSDLVARRNEVCDYCFFGGPTRTVPLIPVN